MKYFLFVPNQNLQYVCFVVDGPLIHQSLKTGIIILNRGWQHN